MCANNPVNFIDPEGQYLENPSQLIAAKKELILRERISNVENLLEGLGNDSPEYLKFTGYLFELNKSLQDISDIQNDPIYEYRLIETQDYNAPLNLYTAILLD